MQFRWFVGLWVRWSCLSTRLTSVCKLCIHIRRAKRVYLWYCKSSAQPTVLAAMLCGIPALYRFKVSNKSTGNYQHTSCTFLIGACPFSSALEVTLQRLSLVSRMGQLLTPPHCNHAISLSIEDLAPVHSALMLHNIKTRNCRYLCHNLVERALTTWNC